MPETMKKAIQRASLWGGSFKLEMAKSAILDNGALGVWS